jgi:putative membrane protein
MGFALPCAVAITCRGDLSLAHAVTGTMEPNFTLIMSSAILFALLLLTFMWWRFGWANTLVFAIMAGLFTALMDFISAFAAQNYEYPGQSRLWVFTFIFFGWIGMCGSCLFVAEGILTRPGQDMLTQRQLWWQVPVLTGIIAVVLDLFIDPVAVRAGYWVWFVKGTVYYEIPLLNYVGWFVLMFLAPLGWIMIARQKDWGAWKKGWFSIAALIPLSIAAVAFSLLLNGMIAILGMQ